MQQFLLRLQPYSEAAKELAGGKFDLPDRLFYSIADQFRCAIEEVADVRELVPEMFFCPELLLNLSNIDFGVMQTGYRVNNVECPKWSGNDPYKFVCILR